MDDARLCLALIRSAHEHGAIVCNHLEAIAFERRDRLRLLDRLTGKEQFIEGEVILNATGPWSDGVRKLAGEEESPLLAPTKGVHLVVADRGLTSALLLLHPRDGRVFFVLPWMGKTLIGTTDTDCPGSPDNLVVSEEDIDYLLEGFNHHLQPGYSRNDLLGHFVGVRPLLRARPGEPSARSREWRMTIGPTGLLSVVGGKWTTYRWMAEVITDQIMRRLHRLKNCRTRAFPLDGAPSGAWSDYERTAVTVLSQRYHLADRIARHLLRRYGTRAGDVARRLTPELAQPIVAGEPDLRAELEYQREEEMACLSADFLLRRTRLGLFHPHLLTSPPRVSANDR
jgi:glycerol-3-phosphate dehydrogenase